MSLLWTRAMPWVRRRGDPKYTPVPVKKAGFAGYVSPSTEDDIWGLATPKPTPSEGEYFREHQTVPSAFDRRHEEGIEHYRTHGLPEEEQASHEDPRLHHFMEHHYHSGDLFNEHSLDTTQTPLYATQTHVAQEHLDKYHHDPSASTHDSGELAPRLITHEGRVHVADGHHRIATAIARGETDLPVWHMNLDHLYMPDYDGGDHA